MLLQVLFVPLQVLQVLQRLVFQLLVKLQQPIQETDGVSNEKSINPYPLAAFGGFIFVGIVIGTYSSIFIAAPVFIDLNRRKAAKA